MNIRAAEGDFDRIEPNMISMIDICFMIIIFFIANMRLNSPEGDFFLKMPSGAPREGLPSETDMLPIAVRLHADRNGNLVGIQLGDRNLRTIKELQRQIRDMAEGDRGPAATPCRSEVEIDCDYNLAFECAVDALDAVSGYVADDGKTIVRTIEHVRFSPPRKR